MQEEYRDEEGSVVGSDFYGATELLGLSDAAIVDKVVSNMTRCEPVLKGAKVSLYSSQQTDASRAPDSIPSLVLRCMWNVV